MDNKALAEQLVKACLAKGADAAEVYIESSRELNVEIRNGDVETVQEASTSGVGVRVFLGGRMAFSHCNDLADASLEAALSSAIAFGRTTTADPSNGLPSEAGVTAVDGLYDASIARVPMDAKINLAKAVEKLAMKDPRITKSAGARYGEEEAEVFLANSNGMSKTYRSTRCGFGVSVVAVKAGVQSPGGESCSRRFYADLLPAAAVAARAEQNALELLDPRPVKTQRAAVIVDPDVAGAILGGLVAAVNGETVLQGASFLGAMLDKAIASDLLTLIDDGTRPKGLASRPFDGEGVPTQKRVIVDRGVLKGFMYNTSVAKRAGVKSTGNATRGGYASLPGIGPHQFSMAAGTTPPGDIVKATKVGLWLKDVTGYGINPVNGNFSGGASGLWIENGKVAYAVRGLTIAATAKEMLNGIDLAERDVDLNRGFPAPLFRIKDMQIGGE
jgi:PmbA protein